MTDRGRLAAFSAGKRPCRHRCWPERERSRRQPLLPPERRGRPIDRTNGYASESNVCFNALQQKRARRSSGLCAVLSLRVPSLSLTAEESQLYDDLRYDRIRPGLRLEQERVDYARVLQTLTAAGLALRCAQPNLRRLQNSSSTAAQR